jgi:hypothetical protein
MKFLIVFVAPSSPLPIILYHTSPGVVLGGQSGLILSKYFGFPLSFIVPPKLHTLYFDHLPSTLYRVLKNGLQALNLCSTHLYGHKLSVNIVQNLCLLKYGLFSCYTWNRCCVRSTRMSTQLSTLLLIRSAYSSIHS